MAAVRLDSGDLGALSKATRAKLDAAGLNHVEIIASSGLDEYRIAALMNDGCPIDAFAVGTKLVVAQDAPALDMAYKLVEYDGTGRTKFSSGKVIYPGRKQVVRRLDHGVFAGDTIGEPDEATRRRAAAGACHEKWPAPSATRSRSFGVAKLGAPAGRSASAPASFAGSYRLVLPGGRQPGHRARTRKATSRPAIDELSHGWTEKTVTVPDQ